MTPTDSENVQPVSDERAVIDVAQMAVRPTPLDPAKHYGVSLRGDQDFQLIYLDHLRESPRRIDAVRSLATVDDLLAYFARYEQVDSSTVWIDETAARIMAVFDDHASQQSPGWCGHRAQLILRPTTEWCHWARFDGKLVGQMEFAEIVEEGFTSVIDPDPAEMLEIASSIQGTRNVEFKTATRLHDGNVTLGWTETTTTRAGQQGSLDIPERFMLSISPFVGEPPVPIMARLRLRLGQGGTIALGYRLIEPHVAIRQCFERLYDRIVDTVRPTDEGRVRVFQGWPS